jgi:hypothetical protein
MKTLGLNRLNRFVTPSLTSAALLIGLAMTSFAAAQTTMTPEQACTGDAQHLCGEFIPDRAKVGACLRRNVRSLSTDCRAFFVHPRAVRGRVYHHYHHHH